MITDQKPSEIYPRWKRPKKVAKEMTNKIEWEKEFEEIGMVKALKDAKGFEPFQYKLMMRLFSEFLAKTREEAYAKGQKEARAHYYERVANQARRETIKETIERTDEYLRQWRISFANRPLAKRENAFNEVVKIGNEIKQNLARLRDKK